MTEQSLPQEADRIPPLNRSQQGSGNLQLDRIRNSGGEEQDFLNRITTGERKMHRTPNLTW